MLLAYLTTHLTNHALGLVSLDAMEDGREWFLALWRNPLATAALYTSLVVHVLLGYGEGVYLTAVGDTVNVAARLEQLTKEYDCPLIVSEQVATRAGLDVSDLPRHEVTVRNRAGVLAVRVVTDVTQLTGR